MSHHDHHCHHFSYKSLSHSQVSENMSPLAFWPLFILLSLVISSSIQFPENDTSFFFTAEWYSMICTYMYMYVYMYICVYIGIHTYIPIYTYRCMIYISYTYIWLCDILWYVHICVYIYTYTHTMGYTIFSLSFIGCWGPWLLPQFVYSVQRCNNVGMQIFSCILTCTHSGIYKVVWHGHKGSLFLVYWGTSTLISIVCGGSMFP
jgi:hypothetical protein